MYEQAPAEWDIFVEIGPGLRPAALLGSRRFDGPRQYVGIDCAIGEYCISEGENYGDRVAKALGGYAAQAAHERPDEHIMFVRGNGEDMWKQLMLANESVREVYMANVLTAPLAPGTRERLFAETERVLRKDGQLVVKLSWDAWLWPPEELVNCFMQKGFQAVEIANLAAHPKRFDELEDIYGPARFKNGYNYFLLAEKIAQDA